MKRLALSPEPEDLKRCPVCRHTERTHAPRGCWVYVTRERRVCGCTEISTTRFEDEE